MIYHKNCIGNGQNFFKLNVKKKLKMLDFLTFKK